MNLAPNPETLGFRRENWPEIGHQVIVWYLLTPRANFQSPVHLQLRWGNLKEPRSTSGEHVKLHTDTNPIPVTLKHPIILNNWKYNKVQVSVLVFQQYGYLEKKKSTVVLIFLVRMHLFKDSHSWWPTKKEPEHRRKCLDCPGSTEGWTGPGFTSCLGSTVQLQSA